MEQYNQTGASSRKAQRFNWHGCACLSRTICEASRKLSQNSSRLH
ncbi:MAG: hypothetical protein EBT89_09920 [Opitutaceae bacterium]|nr:hypothetical protein [Opitutaceae bacterium]